MNEQIDILNQRAKTQKTKKIGDLLNQTDFLNKRIATFGTFDILHEGHIKIIKHAIELTGDERNVYVGVASDEYNTYKGKEAFMSEVERVNLIKEKFERINVFLEEGDPKIC